MWGLPKCGLTSVCPPGEQLALLWSGSTGCCSRRVRGCAVRCAPRSSPGSLQPVGSVLLCRPGRRSGRFRWPRVGPSCRAVCVNHLSLFHLPLFANKSSAGRGAGTIPAVASGRSGAGREDGPCRACPGTAEVPLLGG